MAVQVFISANNKNAKDLPVYATHGPLNDSYFADEASHTGLIQSPNKQRKRKSRLPCCVADSASVFPPCQPRPIRLEGSPLRTRTHEAKTRRRRLLLLSLSLLTKPEAKSFTFSNQLSTGWLLLPLFSLSNNSLSTTPSPTTLSQCPDHTPFSSTEAPPRSRLHAPSGRASSLSANRESGHAFCSST